VGLAGSGLSVDQNGNHHDQDRFSAEFCGKTVLIMSWPNSAGRITLSGRPEHALAWTRTSVSGYR
jgi:hypothetical protein